MCLVAEAVSGLLCGRAVVAEAVGLDDQPEVRPVEVDLEAVHPRLRLWLWEAGPACDGEEDALELGGCKDEGEAVEELAQRLRSHSPGPLIEGRRQRFGVDEVELVRLVDCRFE